MELNVYIHKILNYEFGLYHKIYNSVRYLFKSNEELKTAVDLWCDLNTRVKTEKTYGHIF